MDFETDLDPLMLEPTIQEFVITKRDEWRNDYEANYEEAHKEYYRLWRAIWDPQDQQRKSERSKIIAPALQQAVESNVAEVEEATFGRGKWFDLKDDMGDNEAQDVQFLRNKLMEDFDKLKVRKDISECLLNAAVYGTGVGEIVIENIKEMAPAEQPIMDGQLTAIGVNITDRTAVKLRPITVANFLIDPESTSIDNAFGVIIDEFVSRHQVELLQDRGVYKEGNIGTAPTDFGIEPDEDIVAFPQDRVRLTKYFGLVPKDLVEDPPETDDRYVEAIVIIANEDFLLKAEANPYMMQDRPIVAFQWDLVPSKFWGRGVCEKGYMSQKALDTELRARIDALALVVHPMLAMDSTMMPRGFKPEVRPGKVILTNGRPQDALMPFNFGQLDQNTFNQAQQLQQMVQQATGAIDSTGLLSSVSGDTKAGAVSMSLGAVIKRHKRTLINFQEGFLIPFIKKVAYRYMQYDPENYPVKDYKFTATSTLGIIAREYEVSQLIQLMQTMSPESPMYPALVQSIVDNMNLANREELLAILKKSSEPNPEAEQMQKQMHQMEMESKTAQTEVLKGQASEFQSRAAKMAEETRLMSRKVDIDMMKAISGDLRDGDEDKSFERRLQITGLKLKEKDLDIKREGLQLNRLAREKDSANEAALMGKLSGGA